LRAAVEGPWQPIKSVAIIVICALPFGVRPSLSLPKGGSACAFAISTPATNYRFRHPLPNRSVSIYATSWIHLRPAHLPAAANPAKGPPVTPRIIVSDQTASVGDSQHRSAEVHVHRSRCAHQWLILILVDQRDALRVADLYHRRATPRYGCGRGEKHGELRPSLEDIDHQVVTLRVAVKRRGKVTSPASSEIRDSDEPQFAHETVLP
jgi:hypothetical protein